MLTLANEQGQISGALFGIEPSDKDKSGEGRLIGGKLARLLPAGNWHIEGKADHAELFAVSFLLGGYQFNHYKKALLQKTRTAFRFIFPACLIWMKPAVWPMPAP